MLSSRARYAARAMLDMSMQNAGDLTLVQGIAERQGIPIKYLQRILLDLKQAGFVVSRKGPGGGYSLARPAESITLGQILSSMDGSIVDLGCTVTAGFNDCGCPNPDHCALRLAFQDLADTMLRVLDTTSLADLRDRQVDIDTERKGVLNFVI